MQKFLGLYVLLGILILSACGNKKLAWDYEPQTTPVEGVQADPEIDLMVKPYKQGLKKEMNEVIGYSSRDMIKEKGQSTLGNFVADLAYHLGKDYIFDNIGEVSQHYIFSYFNFGGLRATVTQGEVTVGDVFSLMPFDNEIVVLKLTGEKVQDLIQYNYQFGGQPSSNIEWVFTKKSDENKVIIGNKVFDKSSDYFVITTDYLAGGGDNMIFFDSPLKRYQTGVLLRDAIISYTREQDDIYTPKDNRWNEDK